MFEFLSALATAESARWLSVMFRPGAFEGLCCIESTSITVFNISLSLSSGFSLLCFIHSLQVCVVTLVDFIDSVG